MTESQPIRKTTSKSRFDISITPFRGGSRGRVQGVRTPTPPPPLPEMTCGFLIQLVFCKKNYVVYWC